MLKIKDKWIWDFWFVEEDSNFHMFYLHASKSLIDETKRHHNATIGHAVSKNLINWDILPDALKPSEESTCWDDLATWTGSIIRKDNIWYMFYTGVNKKEKGLIQRIGVATSNDLIHWKKHSNNPVIEADSRWYEMLDLDSWHDHAWRDPYVIFLDGIYYAFITARINYGPSDERGIIALAKSSNLLEWEIMPPISKPGDFGQLEVPQYIKINKTNIILFSTAIETTSKRRKETYAVESIKTGMYYLTSESVLNEYALPNDCLIKGDMHGTLYSGKIVKKNNKNYMIAFHNYDKNGNFLGFISDPFLVNLG